MKNIVVLLIFFLISISSKGQYKFDYLTTKDGLSTNRIGSILRDSKGYLWFGSEIGLDKYDGYKVRAYRHNEKQTGTISNNGVWEIYEDHSNNLWIATCDGLSLYIPESDSFKVFRNNPSDVNSLDHNRIHSLYEDTKGNLWVSTRGNCLNKWVPATQQFIRYPVKNSSGSSFLREDSRGNLWIASEGLPGISRFDPQTGKLTTYVDPVIGPGKRSKKLCIDKDDKIWIAPYDEGLFSFDPATGKFEQFNTKGDGKGTNGKLIISIIEEDESHLLIGVDQGGINRFDKISKTFQYIMSNDKDENGLSNNGIWFLYKDHEEILWVGTSGGGINIYNPKKKRFKLFRHSLYSPNSVSSDFIGCFFEDSQGMIWIGTDNKGLDVYNPKTGTFKNFKYDSGNPFSISCNTIRCIAEDINKDLWVGTWDKGFNRFDRKTGRFFCYLPEPGNPVSLSGPTVWHYIIDHKGIFWLAIHDVGVDLFDPKKGVIKRFIPDETIPNSLSNAKVWYIFEDSKKRIWLCSNDGLNLYDSINNSFIVYKHFPSQNIKVITEDEDKNLWIGTEKGFCQIKSDGKIIQSYDETKGLVGNIIHGMVFDNRGNLWLSTNNGISKFDPETKTFKNFTEKEGLQDNAFFQGSFLKTRNGEVYFGGFKGFNSFWPDSIKSNAFIPPVYITEFQIFNKPVAWGVQGSPLKRHISETKEIILTHLQSVFSFGFTAINYTNPEKNVYAYILEGFEKEWNYTDATRRYVTYTNLNPGEYTFRVKASNNDRVWNEQGTSIKIIILPPWWQTVWFKILSILILIMSVYIAYYLKVASYRKKQKELSILVKQRTNEISHANDELMERQIRIEENAEELRLRTEHLRKTNELLLEKQKLIESQALQLQEANQQLKATNEQFKTTNEQLAVLNSTKDRFFSIIAHDLRNPFHAVSGFAEILLSNYQKLPPEKLEKYLNIIYTSSRGGNTLLENLLQWSRSQTGQIEYSPIKLNISIIAEETIKLLEGSLHKKNITILQQIATDISVLADENMLTTIFHNLLSNAIKFSHENGIITLKSKISDSEVEITVSDSGVGISDKNLTLLFRIDTTVSTKGTANETGTGLGLILCKEFVERHQGRIWVESKAGKGSEFKFTLPLA